MFHAFLLSADFFRNTISESNGLDPDRDTHSVGPDLGPNCLQKFSADDMSHLARKELLYWTDFCHV